MKKMITVALSLMLMVGLSGLAIGGSLDSPGAPSAGSGMYTLQNLYDYMASGTALTVQTSFQEPISGPTAGTMKSTKQIGDDVKAKFEQCTATAADVAMGKTFFCTQAGSWGVRTGAKSNNVFWDGFTDADGALDTIDIANTTANFSTDKYMNTVEVWLGNYDGAVDADEGVYTDDGHKWGQTITTGSSSIVNPTFSFKWKRGQGTISGNITVLLYTTSGGVPNTQMASANYPVSNVGTSYAYHDIQFTATLNANTMYAVYVDAVGSSNGNNTLDWGRTNSNVYSGGTYLHKYSSWSITSNADYIVAIRATDVSNKIIQTKTITVGGNLTAYKLLCSKTTSGTATVQYKISFDNGSSWSSAKDLNTNYTDPSTGTSIKLQILLNGTGAANSASASDYALIVSY